MVSQLPKVKIEGIEYFIDARLNEFRRVDIPFIKRDVGEVALSDDKVELISLRKETSLGHEESCLNKTEIFILNNVNLDKKSKDKIKKASTCWR